MTGLADGNPSKRLDAIDLAAALREQATLPRGRGLAGLLIQAAEEIEQLKELISAHHAVGALDQALIGDTCPVCASALRETG